MAQLSHLCDSIKVTSSLMNLLTWIFKQKLGNYTSSIYNYTLCGLITLNFYISYRNNLQLTGTAIRRSVNLNCIALLFTG